MTQVCSILDAYTIEIDKNPEYIAYDLLDNNPLNEKSVAHLSTQGEEWIENAIQLRKFEALNSLDKEYDKISVWFEPNFESKLKNIAQVNRKANSNETTEKPSQMKQSLSQVTSSGHQNMLGSFENIIGEIEGSIDQSNPGQNATIKLSLLNVNDLNKEAIKAELENGKISFMS